MVNILIWNNARVPLILHTPSFLTAGTSSSSVTDADLEPVPRTLTSHFWCNIEARHLNTCQRAHSGGLGHSWDRGKDLGSIRLDPISRLWQEAMTSLTLRRYLILWAGVLTCGGDGGIEDLGNNRRTNKSRLQENTHQILIRKESLPLPLPLPLPSLPQLPLPSSSDCVCSSDWMRWEESSFFFWALGHWQQFFFTTLQNIQWAVLTALLIAFN